MSNTDKMKLPETNRPVIATLQHFFTKGTRKAELITVNESGVIWRTYDDNSELSYDWDVIDWEYKKEME